jgi:hypothetical protein
MGKEGGRKGEQTRTKPVELSWPGHIYPNEATILDSSGEAACGIIPT